MVFHGEISNIYFCYKCWKKSFNCTCFKDNSNNCFRIFSSSANEGGMASLQLLINMPLFFSISLFNAAYIIGVAPLSGVCNKNKLIDNNSLEKCKNFNVIFHYLPCHHKPFVSA